MRLITKLEKDKFGYSESFYFYMELPSAEEHDGKKKLYWCPTFREFSDNLKKRHFIQFKNHNQHLLEIEKFLQHMNVFATFLKVHQEN